MQNHVVVYILNISTIISCCAFKLLIFFLQWEKIKYFLSSMDMIQDSFHKGGWKTVLTVANREQRFEINAGFARLKQLRTSKRILP